MAGRASSFRTRLLPSLIVIFCALNLFLFAINAGGVVSFPFGLDYGEAPIIDQARRIAAGELLYKTNLDHPPYVIANYPPVYPFLVATLSQVAPIPDLHLGRLISALAACVSGLIAGLIAWRITGSRLSALLAASLLLSCAVVLYWAPLARVDMLALALSLAGLWLLFTRWRSWPWLVVATACLVAAIFTRQTYLLAAPLAGFAWLWHCQRRRAIIFAGLLAATVLLLALLLNQATDGGFFLNTVVANVNPYRVTYGLRLAGNYLRLWPVAVALAVLQVIRSLLPGRNRPVAPADAPDNRALLRHGLLPYTAGALLAALTVGKIGSNLNYFLELSVVIAIWCALAIGRRRAPSGMPGTMMLVLLAAQLVWASATAILVVQDKVIAPWSRHEQYEMIFAEVQTATDQGNVLADETLQMVVQAGQRIYLQPFEYQQIYRDGSWDPGPLVREIEHRAFPLILIDDIGSAIYQERWPVPLRAAIEASYRPAGRIGDTSLYRPDWQPSKTTTRSSR